MPEKLIDLAYTKAEMKEEEEERGKCCGPNGQPAKYPWGLCLHIEKDTMDKLGITKLPGVGDEYHMTVIAKVTQVSQSAREEYDDTASVALQITMAVIDGYETAKEEKAEVKKYGPETAATETAEQRSIMDKYRS